MIVLASHSPRRMEILKQAGLPFTVRVPGIEERRLDGEAPRAYVLRLAEAKAASVEAAAEDFVLAADTTVVVDKEVLEKPHSPAEARRMLEKLNGREHVVLTGVCLRHGGRSWLAAESTVVRFAPMSAAELDAYAESGEPMDKAGGYAIQGLASKHIAEIRGCYFNVVGLPVARVYAMLKAAGYSFAPR